MDEARVFSKCEESSSGVETDVGGPAAEIRRCSFGEIMMHSSKVEVPTVSSISFHKRILEQRSPLGTENVVLEIVVDGIVASFDVESLQKVEILPNFSKGLVIVLIHWSSVDPEVTSHLIEVVA